MIKLKNNSMKYKDSDGQFKEVGAFLGQIAADAVLSDASVNPIQNKVVTEKFEEIENIINDIEISIPVKGRDFWTPADQESIVQQVITALGTPVFGTVDADKNITLTGTLTDGTYKLWFEDSTSGKVTELCTYNHSGTEPDEPVEPDSGEVELIWAYGVKLDKNTGAEGSADGYAASQHIELMDGYTYTFNQVNDAYGGTYGGVSICYYDANGNGLGYELLWDADDQEHSMALTPIDGAATFRVRLYCGGTSLLRPEERYNMTYEKVSTTYTNLIPLAINADGTPYNGGQGWKTGYRLNSNGVETAMDGMEVTGFMPVKQGDVVYLKNLDWGLYEPSRTYVWVYDSSFNKIAYAMRSDLPGRSDYVFDSDGRLVQITISDKSFSTTPNNTAYMRLNCTDINKNSIITVNEPIV